MATGNGKKNDAIFGVILVLLLLLAGWLAWKLTSVPAAQPGQPAQTNNYPPISTTTPLASDFSNLPTVTFTTPVSPTTTTTTPTPAATEQPPAPAQTTPQATPPHPASKAHTNAPTSRPAQTQRVARAQPTRPNPDDYIPPPDDDTSTVTTNATTTAATPFPTADAGPKPGSQLQGYAIILAKQQDPATGRYLLAAVDGKSNLIYIYEVDAATYNEAAPDLMYAAAKVATWKFVSSR